MKTLFLVRHGIAVDIGEKGVRRDADRMLSAEGREKTDAAAKGLRRLDCRPDRIVCSPLVRARETAEILARRLTPRPKMEKNELLLPAARLSELLTWLSRQREETILLVGHMPNLAELASTLLAGHTRLSIDLKKSGACVLTFPHRIRSGQGTLVCLLTPAQLRRAS